MIPCWAASIVAWLACVCCRDFLFSFTRRKNLFLLCNFAVRSVVRQHKPPELLSDACCSCPIPRLASTAIPYILNRNGTKTTLPTHYTRDDKVPKSFRLRSRRDLRRNLLSNLSAPTKMQPLNPLHAQVTPSEEGSIQGAGGGQPLSVVLAQPRSPPSKPGARVDRVSG